MEHHKSPAPLVLPALFWTLGLIAGKYFSVSVSVLAAFFCLLIVFLGIQKWRFPALLMAIIILGMLRSECGNLLPNNHIAGIIKRNHRLMQPITGIIVSDVSARDGKYGFELQLTSIAERKVSGKVLFSTFQDSLQYGDEISTIGLLQQIRKSSNPGSFDYEEYLSSRRIFARGYAQAPILKIANRGKFPQKQIVSLRRFLRTRIEQRFSRHAGFVKAITIGEKQDIDHLRSVLNRAGLSHLLAVSGLHVGIISLVVLFIFTTFIPHRNLARSVTILSLLVYGAICNWSPSVFRAVLMISLFLLSQIFQRKTNTNNLLFASFLIITVLQPEQLYSAGFQMSFTAVFVLLNLLPHFRFIQFKKDEIALQSLFKKTANYCLILMLSSLILNVFLAPITMFHFQQFGLNGILGNLLGIPLIGAILPLALLIIFLPPIPSLIAVYQAAFQLFMLIFDSWTLPVSQLPAHFDFIPLNILQALLCYLILLGSYSLIRSAKFRKEKLIILPILLIIFLFSCRSGSHHQLLKITCFDCGLGDLCLIESPNGERLMIDTGPPEDNGGHFDRSALPYFQKNGMRRLDWLVITHAHNDHYGGLESVFAHLDVKNLVVTDEFLGRQIWSDFAEIIAAEKCRIVTISDTITLPVQTPKLKIIHPDAGFSHTNINNLSIVLKLDYADFSALFTGDLEIEGESYLLQKYPEFLPSDVLKAGHHGSRTASSDDFVRKVMPAHVFISTSLQNRFDFPHPETLQTFDYLDEKLVISGRDGAWQITTDGYISHFAKILKGDEYFDRN